MNSNIFTAEEIETLRKRSLDWLRGPAQDQKSVAIGATNAQALYRRLRDTIDISGITARQTERVQQLNALIFEKIDEAFNAIGLNGFAETFMTELKSQRAQKQQQLKNEAIKKSTILWQATPLSKDQLEGGVLKGRVERPDLVWESVFTGVCAFPDNKGAYVLKHADEQGGFAAQGDVNVRLTDDRLEGKKIDDVLGYLHGHRVTADDGFLPTISLTGEVAGEWVSKQDVTIDESKEVTLRSLVDSGVHIFRVDPEDLPTIRKIKAAKMSNIVTREDAIRADIDIMEKLAADSKDVRVKSYYAEVKKQIAREKGAHKKITEVCAATSVKPQLKSADKILPTPNTDKTY